MSGIVRRRVAPMDADETDSVDSFEAVGFKTVKHQRVPDDEMPDILYSIQFCSSTGRLMETRESAKPLDPKASNTGLEEETSKPTPVIEIRTTVHARYEGADYYDEPHYPPPEPYWSGSDSDCSDNLPRTRRSREPHAKDRTEMVIHSDHLKAALSAVVSYYREFSPEHGIIRAPYQVLVDHWRELELYKLNQPSCHDAEYADTTTKHIDVLLSFLRATFAERFAAERLRQEDPRGAMATFDNFWTLLKPGTVIYRDRNGTLVPYIVSLVRLAGPYDAQGNGEGDNSYYLEFWNIQYSRGLLRRRMKSCTISAWRGERLINSLSVIPERFVTDAAKVAAENIKLGRLYWELAKQPSYMEYDGQVTNGDRASSGRGYKMTGRVIVDCEGWERFGNGDIAPHIRRPRHRGDNLNVDVLPQVMSKCACPTCSSGGGGGNKSSSSTSSNGHGNPGQRRSDPSPFVSFDKLNPKTDSLPDNSTLYLHVLSPTVPAFILSERRWAHIHLSGLGPVRPDLDAFKYLVLDPAIKLTVKSLIGRFAAPSSTSSYPSSSPFTAAENSAAKESILSPATASSSALTPWPTDFVRNKGLGRIFLLHGSPGVGKTCTAECISELARRPLLSLTSGDLSTSMSSSSVERRLSYFLELGERFGALVLLDEADVYLERRRTRDLKRNGLVSVFLRALEYFRGVLFLTTNRVAAFDDAFTSRIHVALYYPELGEEERRRIWGYQFERLERESAPSSSASADGGEGSRKRFYIPQSTKEYAFHHPSVLALKWNGREIRNALQTAVALAETEAAESHPGGSVSGTTTTIALMDKHLKAVVGMSSGFKTFMEGVKKKRKGKAAALLRTGVVDADDNDDENDGEYADEEEDEHEDGEVESDDDDERPGSGYSSTSENGY
ncbi:hypothetical protein SMACR_02851 [Sordaria macrospora]|uniref:AAA+ ATPase domain-containing protein n=1 Tax=Sordaria macrospora TaxID=5147 RepID=A0A8S8ZX32_SORMA|nr:hypothetical protein SMACR_02851 [Sordaria macrospora]WPJ58205.1 hypothetical protein SMAC4_02851 [Sordaria macrospora]